MTETTTRRTIRPGSGTGTGRTFLLAATAVLLAAGCNREPPPATATPTAPTAPTAAVTDRPAARPPAAGSTARLHLVNNSGAVRYGGTVDSAWNRQGIVDALEAAYGARNVSGGLAVDARVQSPPWLDNLGPFIAAFDMPGAALDFAGERIELGGYASDANRAALLDKARALYPGYRYTGLFEGIGPAAPIDDSTRALASLAHGASGVDLVMALNQARFGFEPGSARIAAGSLDLVGKAAGAIKAAPAGTRIEIIGPAIGSGDDADDAFLSRQRAEALKVQLVINGVSPGMIETAAADRPAAGEETAGSGMRFRLLDRETSE